MKSHGKGIPLSINEPNLGGVSDTNAWKMRIESQTAEPPRVHTFRPLSQWPAVSHPRQGEIDSFRSMPSRYA